MKKFCIIGALSLVVALLFVCSSTESSNNTTANIPATTATADTVEELEGFVILSSKYMGDTAIKQYTVYDAETGVMYTILYSNVGGYNGRGVGMSVTPLYEADGTLRLYDPGE